MNKIVMGFDISSSCIGYCVLEINENNEIKFIKMNFIKPIKSKNILERLVETRKKIIEVINEHKPNNIFIEELIKFMPKSTATTVVVLTSFNRMICLTAFDYLNEYPVLLNVMSIRHGIKHSKNLPKKEEIPAVVEKHLDIKFPYKYKKSGAISSESYDMADGTAVALYGAFILTKRIKSKK
jgi:Holliday junction resolvasome RuvABC endonuclease subunit